MDTKIFAAAGYHYGAQYKTGPIEYWLWRHPLKSTFIGPYGRGEAELYTGPRTVFIGAWEVHQLTAQN